MEYIQTVGKLTAEDIRAYVTENIDQAIEKGYIKVFYQPVIRTLTGEICGMEALARWDDPVYGLLPPDLFVGSLESAGKIHKLDVCMINLICRDYVNHTRNKERGATISFNLSRLDFILCDIQKELDSAIEKYKVPRDVLRVEITESTMEKDEMRLKDVIDSFWDRGLRVWMDDFGSGFSSLNVLKDYHFDTLKIDMIFLRDFNQRAREIVKSVVDMAKRIGVHTLAEGVETGEQLEFLKNIGCEKAQGYFIGKPMNYENCLVHLAEKGYCFEEIVKRQYYHDIGRVNVLSAMPLISAGNRDAEITRTEQIRAVAIVELKGRRIQHLFANENYRNLLKGIGVESPEYLEQAFGNGKTVFGEKFLAVMRRTERTGQIESADFQKGRNYCYAQVRYISSYPGGSAFLCILFNLSREGMLTRGSRLAEYMKSIYSVYERIELVDLDTGLSENLFRNAQTLTDYNRLPAADELRIYASQEIYPEDRERFLNFVDLTTLEKRMNQSAVGFLTAPFRTRTENGHYVWELCIWLYAGDNGDRKFLCCSRRMENEVIAKYFASTENEERHNELTPELLWNNLERNADISLFWKDEDRRFVGVSRSFLDYYGMDSVDEVRGKTDEDMGWHLEPAPYRQDEEKVMEQGMVTHFIPGSCIRKGENRDIVASKMPIYSNGRIVGLMGYFMDVSEVRTRDYLPGDISHQDVRTETLNYVGIVEMARRFQDSYSLEKKDFVLLYVDIMDFEGFIRSYGKELADALLFAFAEKLKEAAGENGVVGRLEADHFLIIAQCRKPYIAEELQERVSTCVAKIHEVKGVPCTVYYYSGFAYYSETKDLQRQLDKAREIADMARMADK